MPKTIDAAPPQKRKEPRDPNRIDQPDDGENGEVRQQYIEGTEPPKIPEIEKAAETYRQIRDRRMDLTKEEAKANELLLELMKKHGVAATGYRYDGSEVTVKKEKEKARVRRIKAEGEGGDNDDE